MEKDNFSAVYIIHHTLPVDVHGPSLQLCSLEAEPTQGLPPFSACWVMTLLEVCTPKPHLLLQDPHGPQLPQVQSTEGEKQTYNTITLGNLINVMLLPGIKHI